MNGSCVYFLGAGASVGAGVPITEQLLERVLAGIRRSKRGDRTKPQTRLLEFCETFDLGQADEGERPPIVEAISLIDTCIREARPPSVALSVEALRGIRTTLTIELAKAIGRSKAKVTEPLRIPIDAVDQGRPRAAQYQKRFARMLRPRPRVQSSDLWPADSVITTNYDTTLDRVLYELVYWEASTGDGDYSPFYDIFLGSAFRDPYDDSDALEDPESVVDLLKLHGSLNWLYCPRCSRIVSA